MSNELMIPKNFDIAAYGEEFKKDLKGNLEGLDSIALPKIKVMKDSAMFDMGEDRVVKELTGHILKAQITRAKWDRTMDELGDDKSPECAAHDGKMGSKYGNCATCQFNAFNAAKNPALKDSKTNCKTSLEIYVKCDDNAIPYHIRFSATTLKYWKAFMVDLSGRGIPMQAAKINFTLVKEETNKMKYSTGRFKAVALAGPAEYQALKKLALSFESAMTRSTEKAYDDPEKPIAAGNPDEDF